MAQPSSLKKVLIIFSVIILMLLALAPTFAARAAAADRPFPSYDLSFQELHGEVGADGSCVQPANPKVTHLTTLAFHATVKPCNGVRTTVKFYSSLGKDEYPTLEFRWGTTWQYLDKNKPGENYIWKPIENLTYDGKAVPEEDYPVKDFNAVTEEWGGDRRMSGGWFRPRHFIFEDSFGDGEVHTFQYDAWVPATASEAGLTWGTGSTGDGGGSIGATANGLTVDANDYPLAAADFRFVKDADYRLFHGVDAQNKNLPGREFNRRIALGDEKTPFDLISCLEDRQLAGMRDRIKTKEIYPELPYDTEIPFIEEVQELGLAAWPYEFSLTNRVPGKYDPMSGLRLMNYNNSGHNPQQGHRYGFDSYELSNPGKANLPYRPTIESIIRDIPTYKYVDNDLDTIPVLRGIYPAIDLDNPFNEDKTPNYKAGKNIFYAVHDSGASVQHFYYTYKPVLGTFKLEKTDKASGTPVAGARFKLYKEPDMKEYLPATEGGYKCKKENLPELVDLQVCKSTDPNSCETKKVLPIAVPGGEKDGSFTSDSEGSFIPKENNWMESGTYFLQEISVPAPYVVGNPVSQHKVNFNEPKDGKMLLPAIFAVTNEKDTPPPPPLAKTGINAIAIGEFAAGAAFLGVIIWRVQRKRHSY